MRSEKIIKSMKGETSMKFAINHTNLTVFDLEKSLEFYDKALGLKVESLKEADDGSFKIVYLTDGENAHRLELTWYRDKAEPWNLGDNEIHVCFRASDYDAAYKMHKEMDVICYENTSMGLYFIADPDGYWMEITRDRSKDS